MWKNNFLWFLFTLLLLLVVGQCFLIKIQAADLRLTDNYIQIDDWTAPQLVDYPNWFVPERNSHYVCGHSLNATEVQASWLAWPDLSEPITYQVDLVRDYPDSQDNPLPLQTWTAPSNPYYNYIKFEPSLTQEGRYLGWQLTATDSAGNTQQQFSDCFLELDRTAPRSTLTGNLPEIPQPHFQLSALVEDEGQMRQDRVDLYYRYKTTEDGDWETDFIHWRQAGSGQDREKIVNFDLDLSEARGTGFYQFITRATDATGNQEGWPLEIDGLPISKVGFGFDQATDIPQLSFIDQIGDEPEWTSQAGSDQNFPNLDFSLDDQYWLFNHESGMVKTLPAAAQSEQKVLNFQRLSNDQSQNNSWLATYQFPMDDQLYYHNLSFRYRTIIPEKLPGVYDQLLNYEWCGEKYTVNRSERDTDWQTIQLSTWPCQRNQIAPQLVFSWSEQLNNDDQLTIQLQGFTWEENLINNSTRIRLTNPNPSEFPEIACQYQEQNGASYQFANPTPVDQPWFELSFSNQLVDDSFSCTLVNQEGVKSHSKKWTIKVQSAQPELPQPSLIIEEELLQSSQSALFKYVEWLPETDLLSSSPWFTQSSQSAQQLPWLSYAPMTSIFSLQTVIKLIDQALNYVN